MDYYRKIIFQSPVDLFIQYYLLLFQVSFVPIKIHADLPYSNIFLRKLQFASNYFQFFFIIVIDRSRMQTNHRKTVSFINATG